jgi:hypothetical protein
LYGDKCGTFTYELVNPTSLVEFTSGDYIYISESNILLQTDDDGLVDNSPYSVRLDVYLTDYRRDGGDYTDTFLVTIQDCLITTIDVPTIED